MGRNDRAWEVGNFGVDKHESRGMWSWPSVDRQLQNRLARLGSGAPSECKSLNRAYFFLPDLQTSSAANQHRHNYSPRNLNAMSLPSGRPHVVTGMRRPMDEGLALAVVLSTVCPQFLGLDHLCKLITICDGKSACIRKRRSIIT